jgi:hypothetical protein
LIRSTQLLVVLKWNGAALLLGHLLLPGDGHALPLARARVVLGALAAHRQAREVALPPVALDLLQPLDGEQVEAPLFTYKPIAELIDQLNR